MPRNSAAVSKDVREVIEAAYEGARADLTGRLAQEQVDQKALRDGVAAVRGAVVAMIELDQPEHPVLGIRDTEDFFAKVHRAPTLRDEFLNEAVLALIERFGTSARNIDVLQKALAPLDGRTLRTKRPRSDERIRDGEGGDGADSEDGRGAKRRAEVRAALVKELKKWVEGGEQGRFTNSQEFREQFGCARPTCDKVFTKWVDEGLMERQGRAAGTHYVLTAKGRRALLGKADGAVRQAA